MKHLLVVPIFLACLLLTQDAYADGLAIKSGDTIQKILEDLKGKQVTLHMSDGQEITGTISSVTKELVQLKELSYLDYYDGIVEIGKISAVIVKVRK